MATSAGDKAPQMSPQDGSDDEYEYEYSATETETYYLTLDLSLPDFIQRGPDEAPHNRRGGYSIWYNSAFNKSDPNPPTTEYIEENEDADDGTPAEREDDEDGDVGGRGDQASTAAVSEMEGEQGELQDIQILELHSENPIVSYRNRVLRGSWMRNMGTEMILAEHDSDDPLPAIRSLAPDVDLLAASSSRIAFAEVDLQEKATAGDEKGVKHRVKSKTQRERIRRNKGVYINVTSDKQGDRVPQACFLEDLTALKRKRGETDEVTVMALEPPTNEMTVEQDMHMRRPMRNVKNRKRHRRNKGGRDAEGDGEGGDADEGADDLG